MSSKQHEFMETQNSLFLCVCIDDKEKNSEHVKNAFPSNNHISQASNGGRG